jgi:hypothetical protein
MQAATDHRSWGIRASPVALHAQEGNWFSIRPLIGGTTQPPELVQELGEARNPCHEAPRVFAGDPIREQSADRFILEIDIGEAVALGLRDLEALVMLDELEALAEGAVLIGHVLIVFQRLG